MPLIITRSRVIICLLGLISLAPFIGIPAAAQPVGALPVLTSAVTAPPPTVLMAVHGRGFTPGGAVSIVVYDRWGEDVYRPVTTVASTAQYGPNGSADPAQGYVPAGEIHYVVDLVPDTVYGPNGSADPAQGYTPGPAGAAGPACGQELMVRAFDLRSSTWTNLVDVATAC